MKSETTAPVRYPLNIRLRCVRFLLLLLLLLLLVFVDVIAVADVPL